MFFSALTVWLLQLYLGLVASKPHKLERAISGLKPQLSSGAVITLPWDKRWDELQIRATSPRLVPHYSVVVEAATESDVQATVALASRFNIPFLAVSGGHGWTSTLDKLPYGIQINLRKLNTTTVNHDGKTATVGGGTLQHEIVRSLFAKGKYTTTGLCECTSVAGPLLGGGHSYLQGQYGYVLDNLVSARVVTASGELVEASSTKNPDLFWALRGAGHNFGIMTSFTMKVYDVASNWTAYSILFASDKVEALFDLVNEFEEPSSKRPAKMALTAAVIRLPPIDPIKPVISFTLVYEGPEHEAAPYAAQFQALGPISTRISNMKYQELYAATHNGLDAQPCVKNNNMVGAGISVPAWDLKGVREAITIFGNLSADPRFSKSTILLENYGMQGVRAVDPSLTSLPLEERQLPGLASPILFWEGEDEQTTQDAHDYVRRIKEALFLGVDKNNGTRHSYLNYANGDESRQELYGYGEKLEKLVRLKKIWDSENRFGFYNSLV
ncbi:hypothetical protein BDU57DRAFT_485443 [Ampelomyces quisqualis]|uniref:FAD-binding PCMH-type domain-containing protein n=1 Tax=Ampelomyces quisqualis TaxID=50730 RepID=A0A6A5Q815_AMPQU|nr:hypothetical protein BDU57DRAFT_485443 [Ampelomyces quisqualis]